MLTKGTRFETSYNNETYEFIGKWSDALILAPENIENIEVLIYTENEVEQLIKEGKLQVISSQEMRMG